MSTTATSFDASGVSPKRRLEVLFDRLGELTGQRNAIDGEIVDIVAEIDHEGLWGATGFRSVASLVACRTGVSPHTAKAITAVAQRTADFPQCTNGMREGWLSLDQVGVIADKAGDGSDAHYAQFARHATVTQLRKAIALEPRPTPPPLPDSEAEPAPRPDPPRSITTTSDDASTTWHITLPHTEAAEFDAALRSHQDKLVAEWKRDHADRRSETTPPFPHAVDGLLSLVHAGWDSDVAARPHGQRTTVVVHLDVETKVAALHLGPLLPDDDRRFLTCDATCEVWFERAGQVIGSGRETRTISQRLRRALEHRDRCCVVPGCGSARGLHAHHLRHWEDGGPTELSNLVLVCPFHHRLHHRGGITLTGPADLLEVTDAAGRRITAASLARPPTAPPPDVPPSPGPGGQRRDWWWYHPYEPPPSTRNGPTPPRCDPVAQQEDSDS